MYGGFSTIQTFTVWNKIKTNGECKTKIKQGMTFFAFETWLETFIENSASIQTDMGVNKLELYFALSNT